MASSNAAFTKKLRLAIKAKIQELGVDADDELPDYVMVLAANKKDKQLMRDDLQIFLGKSTAAFVDWLFDAFDRIQKGIAPPKPPESEKRLSDSIKNLPQENGNALEKFDRGKRHILVEFESKEKKKKVKKKKDKREETPEGFLNTFEQIQGPKHKIKKKRRDTDRSPSPVRKHHEKEKKKHKKKKRTPSPVYNAEKHTLRYDVISDDEEDIHVISDDESIEEGELTSRRPKFKPRLRSQLGCIVTNTKPIEVNQEEEDKQHRKHHKPHRRHEDEDADNKIEASSKIFVNKNAAIFKKAISSASLNSHVNVEGSSRRRSEHSETRVMVETKETGVQADPPDPVMDFEPVKQSKNKTVRKRRADDPLRTVARLMGMELNKVKKSTLEVVEKSKKSEESPKKEVVSNPESSSSEPQSKTPSFSGWNGQITIDDSSSEDGEEAEIDAFVASAVQERHVLDAQLPPTAALSRPHLYASQQKTMLVLAQTTAFQPEVSQPTPTIPINERCRFWPNCTKGASCPYIHPTQTCAKFPSCFYGNKCLYIHPLCKYGITCKKPNCPFTHVEGAVPLQKTVPVPVFKSQIMCKFKGRCENTACEFKHPPLCVYGMACNTYGCTFLHRKPDLSKFKWKKS
ncbi:unnamed protein product [Bursaphelenchus xylophilus]|uniref:Zinc finger CCCH domain-containing protein 14 n=1 Tax=Bursaphelenchus xylophilus TaxID=6326 RepID=A0A1I7RSC2_BURXY|nr:unnamed protein product [Bursaphelenchus xylophilus]CAG9123056.1 unnamed protein product [Bursaphelenchus xylophilus]